MVWGINPLIFTIFGQLYDTPKLGTYMPKICGVAKKS